MQRGFFAAVMLVAAGFAQAATFVVNSEGDQSNANPGNGSAQSTAGTVTLRSAIQEVNALEGVHTILIDRALVDRIAPTTPLPAIQRNAVTLTGDGVLLDGSQVTGTFQDADGLVLESGNSRIEEFRIQHFRGHGIRITGNNAAGNLVAGCTIGGILGEGNRDAGILLENGVQGTLIGGTSYLDANAIAGNGQAGILVRGDTTFSNIFQRNRIFENGPGPKGIVLESGAQDGVAAPEIVSLNPVQGRAAPNGQVELFVDRGRQAETFVATVFADEEGFFEADLDLTDFITKPFVSVDHMVPLTRFLTATAMDTNGNTSAISNAVLIRGTPTESAGKVGFSGLSIGNGNFEPGGTLQVFLTVERMQLPVPEEVEVVEVLPDGWTLATSNATGVSVAPAPGSGPNLRWVFNNFPETGRTFSYTVNVPPTAEGLVAIEGQATMALDGVTSVASPRVREELLESGFAKIVGKVADIDSGQPIPCATVEFESLDEPGERFFAVVDGNGQFQFLMLPFGSYNRRALAPGYSGFLEVEVNVSLAFTALQFNLVNTPANALVRGIVTDADTGRPLAGVFVQARSGATALGSTYTCASGAYEIPRPNPFPKRNGTPIEVDFSTDNYDPATQSVEVPADGAAEANQALDKGILFPSALAGLITSADTGAAPTAAQVVLQGPVNTLTPVEGDGTYLFDAILDGNYWVQASAPGFESSSKFKQVGSNAIETLNFSLTPLPPQENPFDINGDGAVNAVDVQLVINAALGIPITPFNADVNGDGAVNAVDVQLVINAALGLL